MTDDPSSTIPFVIHGEGSGVAQRIFERSGLEFENRWTRAAPALDRGS